MKTMTLVAAGLLLFGSPWLGSAQAQSLLEELEKRLATEPAAPPVSELAAPQPGYLGLVADEATEIGKGVVVISVREAGPAATAGIKAGDHLAAINRRAIRNLDDMAAAMRDLSAGTKIEIALLRAGRLETVAVTLSPPPVAAARPADDIGGAEPVPGLPAPEFVPSRPILGVHVDSVTDEARLRYGVPVRRGAMIEAIQAGSPADRYGLPLGGVIVGVDGRPVNSPEDLVEILSAARPGQEVELSYYQGERLFRKTVRLSPAALLPGEALAPAPDAPLRLVPGAEDRPVLRKLESALDRLTTPPVPATDTADASDAATLRRQLDEMRSQIDQMQRRIIELEKSLAAERARKE
jgi:membrane-associated protease RseP (regulator of RpoE activity)